MTKIGGERIGKDKAFMFGADGKKIEFDNMCPMVSFRNTTIGHISCVGSQCAWWDKERGRCGVL